MNWRLSHRFDKRALPLADAHYNRQKIGSPQFVPPGRCIVLLTEDATALWVSSWPQFTKHAWAGAWINTLFRNESGILASSLITEAIAITRYFWTVPDKGMVTFIDTKKVRHKRDPGRCYLRAGFKVAGRTKVNDLLALQLLPNGMPLPLMPVGAQFSLFAREAA